MFLCTNCSVFGFHTKPFITIRFECLTKLSNKVSYGLYFLDCSFIYLFLIYWFWACIQLKIVNLFLSICNLYILCGWVCVPVCVCLCCCVFLAFAFLQTARVTVNIRHSHIFITFDAGNLAIINSHSLCIHLIA